MLLKIVLDLSELTRLSNSVNAIHTPHFVLDLSELTRLSNGYEGTNEELEVLDLSELTRLSNDSCTIAVRTRF